MAVYGRQRGDSRSVPLFHNVKYDFHKTLSQHKAKTLQKILEDNGAERCFHEQGGLSSQESSETTHIISTRETNGGGQGQDLPYVVTPAWVEAANKNGFVHDPKYYKPDTQLIFTGMVVATADLSKHDNTAIKGAVERFGGQYSEELWNDVTHIVARSDEGERYRRATKLGGVKIVHPQFIDDCVKFRRLVREDSYLMPDPPCLREEDESTIQEELQNVKEEEALRPLRDLIYQYPGYNYADNKMFWPRDLPVTEPFLKDHCFYFAPGSEIEHLRSFDWKGRLEKAGASVAHEYDKDKVTIVICKNRHGDEYVRACRDGKTVATMWWVSNTLMRQRFESPLRTLLDYPPPRGGIPGMQDMVVALTGFRGVARYFLRRLLYRCGCDFKASLSSKCTHLIVSSKGTAKYKRARELNITVVNHLWLEECYQRWMKLSVADERYVHFPADRVLDSVVGSTPLLPEIVQHWWKEGLEKLPEVPRKMESAVSPESVSPMQGKQQLHQQSPGLLPSSPSQPRQAAQRAASKLEDVYIPDMNKYQKEVKSRKISFADIGDTERADQRAKAENGGADGDKATNDGLEKGGDMMDLDRPGASGRKRLGDSESSQTQSSSRKKKTKLDELLTGAEHIQQLPAAQQSKTVKIVTTGIQLSRDDKNDIRQLGGSVVDTVTQATHLVVEKRALRTPKFLCAINLGLPIVSHDWIKQSAQKRQWLDAGRFAIKDAEMEKKHRFSLEESLSIAKDRLVPGKHPHGTWLSTFEVHVLQSNKADALKDVIETAGGKLITKLTPRRIKELTKPDSENQLLIVSDPKDEDKWHEYTKKLIPVYDVELIITGALRQELDIDEFYLAS